MPICWQKMELNALKIKKNCFQYNCDTNTYTISVHIFTQDFTPITTIFISQYEKLDSEYAGVVLYFTIVKNHQQ